MIQDPVPIPEKKEYVKHVAKLKLDAIQLYELMKNKFVKKHGIQFPNSQPVGMLQSWDGANHRVTTKGGETSVLSCSNCVFNRGTVSEGFTTAKSDTILTWQQILASESPQNVMPAFREYYSCIRKLQDENGDVIVYDCHDGKMLYILTQHSLWNRSGFPFLLCKCRRGDCVKNVDHHCELIGDKERLELYEKSLARFALCMGDENNPYSRKKHRKWCDVENNGITHFGIHPNDMCRSSIRFDVFHMRSAITRKLLNRLRSFMRKQTFEIQQGLS